MTTDRPPLDDLDLSAYLDDEAGEDVSARLEADPAARERLEQLRAARDAVADEVTPLSDGQVDFIVAAAMAASDGDTSQPDDDHQIVPVPPSSHRGGPPMWAVAAVVAVLVGIGLALVWTGRDAGETDMAFEQVGSSIGTDDAESSRGADVDEGSADDGASATEMAPEAGAASDQVAGTAEPSTTTAGAGSGAPTLVYLGTFPDPDALRVHLRDGFPATGAGPLPDTGITDDLTAAFRCLGKVDGLFTTSGEPTDVGLAEVDGAFVVVYDMPYRTDEGRDTTLVIAVDEVSCTPVLTFQR